MPPKPYVLTPTARRQLREAREWSLTRWGRDIPSLLSKYALPIRRELDKIKKT